MDRYRIDFQHRALREFEDLPFEVRRRFYIVFEQLAMDPLRARSHCDVRRLKGVRGAFAVRVGAYRGTFEIVEDTIWFARFAHRSVVYR